MFRVIITILVIAILVVAGFFIFSGDNTINANVVDNGDNSNIGDEANTILDNTNTDPNPTPNPNNNIPSNQDSVKTFNIVGKHFKFYMNSIESPDIKVNLGDRVKIIFTNEEGFHDWKLDEFSGAATNQINAGQTETIEFTADRIGTFEYYCSVGQHRAMGMKGSFIVE